MREVRRVSDHVLVEQLDVPPVQAVLTAIRRDDHPVLERIAVIADGQQVAEPPAVDTGDGGWRSDGVDRSPMRVVAGTCRGLTIAAPPGTGTRPTGDRVRESVFNSLHSLDALDRATVVDLFAGSGALAATATFVESAAGACAAVESNLVRCGLADRGRVVRSDAMTWRSYPSAHADLLLADPPYEFDGWEELLGAWTAVWLVVESDREVELGGRWQVERSKVYGQTHVIIARGIDPPGSALSDSLAPESPH